MMSWRILTDENVEPATRNYLKKLGHDIEHVVTVDALGQSVSDAEIAEYARRTDRVILTQDNDFFLELDVKRDTEGVLYQQDQEISARQAGDIVQNITEYYSQSEIVLEYISEDWL
jgi:predicted nuclease of predicted toxin-antitoxin system